METITLWNRYRGEKIAEVSRNLVKTEIGIYRVDDYELQWLIDEAAKRRDFSALDVRMVGTLISKK